MKVLYLASVLVIFRVRPGVAMCEVVMSVYYSPDLMNAADELQSVRF